MIKALGPRGFEKTETLQGGQGNNKSSGDRSKNNILYKKYLCENFKS